MESQRCQTPTVATEAGPFESIVPTRSETGVEEDGSRSVGRRYVDVIGEDRGEVEADDDDDNTG